MKRSSIFVDSYEKQLHVAYSKSCKEYKDALETLENNICLEVVYFINTENYMINCKQLSELLFNVVNAELKRQCDFSALQNYRLEKNESKNKSINSNE